MWSNGSFPALAGAEGDLVVRLLDALYVVVAHAWVDLRPSNFLLDMRFRATSSHVEALFRHDSCFEGIKGVV